MDEAAHQIRIPGVNQIQNAVHGVVAADRAGCQGDFAGEPLLFDAFQHALDGKIGEQAIRSARHDRFALGEITIVIHCPVTLFIGIVDGDLFQ